MDASPNQVSEVEFEQLLYAASQNNRLQVVAGNKKVATSMIPNDVLFDKDLAVTEE